MSVYTLALAFIDSCPPGNPTLPFTAFPSLAYDGKTCTCEQPICGNPSAYIKRDHESYPWGNNGDGKYCKAPLSGATVSFTAMKKIPAGSYVTFVNGLVVTSVKGTVSGKTITAKIPAGLGGQTYVFATKSDVEGTFDDTQVLFGPAILEVRPAPPSIDYSILK